MRRFLILALVWASMSAPASAETAQDKVVRHLQAQGFENIEVRRTWLGRVRITGENQSQEREIILNPATGEILRDYWEEREGASPGGGLVNPGQGASSGDDDDPDRDEGEDGEDGDSDGDSDGDD